MPHPTNGCPDPPGDASPGQPRQVGPRRSRSGPVFGVTAGLALLALMLASSLAIYRSGQAAADLPIAPATPTATANRTARQSPSPPTRPTAAAPLPSAVQPSVTPGARPRSTTRPPAPPAPRGPDQSLTRNAVYRIDLDGRRIGCDLPVRSPRPPLKDDKLAPYLRQVVGCLVKTFRQPLAEQGFTLTTPRVVTYRKTIKTPCGTYGQDKAPAFYCSADHTVYWAQTSDEGREAYTYARLGYVALMAHEFGHHLQTVTGMLTPYAGEFYAAKRKGDRYLLSRRLELQAQCFEGVFLNQTARSTHLSSKDRSQLRTWHGFTGDEDPPKDRLPDHGTSRAQVTWLQRGLDSADFGRCNTWTAEQRRVK